ncbi:MAG: hypothetical protein ACR2N9_09565 [Acidimicrobiia bacterium]
MADDPQGETAAKHQAEARARSDADELLARAARIRLRSSELVDSLGSEHPLVARALERAAYLEAEAARPGHIDLR